MYEKQTYAFLKHLGVEVGLFQHDKAMELLTTALNAVVFRGTRNYSYSAFCDFFSGPYRMKPEESRSIFARYGGYFRHEADDEKIARILRGLAPRTALSDYDALLWSAGHVRRTIRQCGKLDPEDERHNVAAFTGPRPEKLGDVNAALLITALDAEIRRAISDGFDTFYDGASRGVDLTAARLVLDLKQEYPHIKLYCALPFDGQSEKWNRQDSGEYRLLLNKADRVETISEVRNKHAYLLRNEHMADRSDRLISVYDDVSGGGTGYTVLYAEKLGLDVVRIDPNNFRAPGSAPARRGAK